MCGRFGLFHTWQDMVDAYGLVSPALNLAPRWNIAPTHDILAVIRGAGGGNAGVICRWGLVPGWAKDVAIGARTVQARAETAHEKPAFRAAMRRRRALIPASGFYEWRAREGGGPKQPFWIARADGGLLALAGLWEIWTAPDGSALRTAAILTTGANAALAPVHHRMPAIVPPDAFDDWLGDGIDENGEAKRARELLTPRAGGDLEVRPVSRAVNAVRNDHAGLIERVEPEAAAAESAPAPRPAHAAAQGELF